MTRIAAFMRDGIAITNDWTTLEVSGGPTWSFIDLEDLKAVELDDDVTQINGATVDAFSPRYINGSGGVNVWIVTDRGVHKITDVFGNYSVANQHPWDNPIAESGVETAIAYMIHSERGQQGFVCATQYRGAGIAAPKGLRAATTVNGGSSWIETQVNNFSTLTSRAYRMGLHVSGKIANKIYVTAFTGNSHNTGLYISTDAGTTWSNSTSPVNMNGGNVKSAIHIPWGFANEGQLIYSSFIDQFHFVDAYKWVTGGGTMIHGQGPFYHHGINSDPDNYLLMALCGRSEINPGTTNRLYVSTDGGSNWTQKDNATSPDTYTGCHVVRGAVYAFGDNAHIVYLPDFSGTVDVKTGNLATLSTARIWNIVGEDNSLGMTNSIFTAAQSPAINTGSSTCNAFEQFDPITPGSNPISVRFGEKREEITDFSLNTPAGPLAFTRYYRQNQQADPDYQFMGRGWTHNHRLLLQLDTPTTGEITLLSGDGGRVFFSETSTDHYEAAAGSTAFIDWDSNLDEYLLTSGDKSTYLFDSSGILKSRSWPNGETWSYTHSGSQLMQVDDGYGRKLVFRYYASGAYAGQLYRVGDQTFDDTDPQNPTGRYVELLYIPSKKVDASGAIVDGISPQESLLAAVTDVRDPSNPNKTWTYDYYGQDTAETDVRQLNFLIARHSPVVDAGDGSAAARITIEDNTYTMQGSELAVDGGMELADTDPGNPWTAVGSATHQRSSNQVQAGSFSRYVDAAAGEGIEGNLWDLTAGQTYVITAWVYRVSGSTGNVKLTVANETAFDRTVSSSDTWTLVRAVYTPTADALDRSIQFLADGGAAEFYVDAVSVIESDLSIAAIQQQQGNAERITDYTFLPEQDMTTEETADRTSIHHFTNGVYRGVEDPAGHYGFRTINQQYRPFLQTDANGNSTLLTWSIDGKRLYKVRDALGQETEFLYDVADRLHASVDAEGRTTIYAYEDLAVPRQPTLVLVTDSDLAVNGGMELDSDWTAVGSPTTNLRSNDKVDTGSYARHVVADAAAEGIQGNALTLVTGRTYLALARVYPVSGNLQMKLGSSTQSTTAADLGQWTTLKLIMTGSGSSANLQFLSDGGAAEFYVDTVHLFDATQILRWQAFAYDSQGRTLEERLIDPDDGVTVLQKTTRTYSTSGNGNGLLESVTQVDVQDASNNSTTNYTYDSAGRVIKTQKSSLFGTCSFTYTVYDEAGNVLGTACGRVDSTAPTDVNGLLALYDDMDDTKKHTRVTLYEYDAMGRRIQTTVNAGTLFYRTSRTVYDALSRVVRTIDNYVSQGTSAPGEWVWRAVNSNFAWRLSASDDTVVGHGDEQDENIIADTDYNARGLVYRTRDVLGRVTLYGYDLADRLVKTIQNASDPDYDASYGSGHPALDTYTEDTNSNVVDIISEQFYDAAGNLVQSIDPANRVSFTVYDALNRPVKVVRNAKAQATIELNPGDVNYDAANDPRSESYAPDTASDRDQIELTEYDAMGRVLRSQRLLENRQDETWSTTFHVYDALGRQVRTIQNYEPQGSSDPADWIWDATDQRWEDGSSNPIVFGADNDQNIISASVYDNQGRVIFTQDVNGSRTWSAYDGQGRQVKSIQNALGTATDGGTNDPRSASYNASSAPDEDLITRTFYNVDGLVERTQDAFGRWTLNGYDNLGRRIRTIQNASDPDYVANSGPPTDTALANYLPATDADRDLISDTLYDDQGRVVETIDPRGNISHTVYAASGRVHRTIRNYVAQNATDPAGWFWNDTNWQQSVTDTTPIDHGADNNQNLIAEQIYDLLGRVVQTRQVDGTENAVVYDALGRRVRSITNYVPQGSSDPADWIWATDHWEDGSSNTIDHGTDNDQNLITETQYDKAGQVLMTRDTRGTETAFTYDAAGRRQFITQAANTALAMDTYTAYDKAGRVRKTIRNYVEQNSSNPVDWIWDASDQRWEDGSGMAIEHTAANDQNLITDFSYDGLGRRIRTTNAEGNTSATTYYQDSQVEAVIDAEGIVTKYRYDELRRRRLVVQSYEASADPDSWSWNGSAWEY